MSEKLSSRSAIAREAVQRREGATIGVVHFGPGAFHRAHQAWYFDQLLKTDKRWMISGVSLKSPGVADALNPQDGLYVLAELDRETRFGVVGSIAEVLTAARQREAVLQRLADPRVGWISSTVTEKGYCLTARGELDETHPDIVADLANPRAPASVIGYLVEGLRRRREAGAFAPVVASCDNLADNGHLLKRAVVQLASAHDAELAKWIAGEVAFPRSMVDSITPATDDALRALVHERTGVIDAWPIQRERFVQWVVEDVLPPLKQFGGAPDLASVGVEITSDVGGYERTKLRLLNGAHSTLAYLGLLRGRETVNDAMNDAPLAAFVERMMRRDIAPLVRAPKELDVTGYIAALLDRFRNQAIRHNLSQIAWDGSKKLPFRIMDTILDARAAGREIGDLAMPLAAWMAFVRRQAKAGIAIVDPLADRLAGMGEAGVDDFLALPNLFPDALRADAGFRADLARRLDALTRNPMTLEP